jgi:ribonuclease E
MANKMLMDATHPEETRVVVLRGNRVEEFDFESANRRQLRGNIYLAKVTRVEPSLQAAFVDYGGNRHGFLAFSEIHPDYYQIPVADRQALIDEEERAHRDAEAEADRRAGMRRHPRHRAAERRAESVASEPVESSEASAEPTGEPETYGEASPEAAFEPAEHTEIPENGEYAEVETGDPEVEGPDVTAHEAGHDEETSTLAGEEAPPLASEASTDETAASEHADGHGGAANREHGGAATGENAEGAEGETVEVEEEEIVESVGGSDAMEDVPDRTPRYRRQYKIQEVIKRRQIMLVQVVKEERGTKGAALTTYLSLAGRYSVLMPNTARGGGISRKITNVQDRKRLKEIAQELEVPEGMGVILRTAGAARTKTEIKRDFEYLLRAWETVRDLTLKSTAPTLVYEEGSLVKRSIRDLYNKDIDEVIVAGDEAYRDARDFMAMLMPSHAKNVRLYRESQPLLARYGIESQLDAMFSPVVQLRSGGYIVLNQAEALVAIDVNSGRATREHHIEDTALKTNLEAAEEIARQLRLRDLAGLIVIDFIDMDEKRNNRSVERRLKDCLKNDRARIQVGRISHFGLLEMSRQRIRASVLESTTDKCPHCGGTGHVRSVGSIALQCLRMIEEQLQRGATHNIVLRTRSEIALYVLNQKRSHLYDLEHRFQVAIAVNVDSTISGQLPFLIEKGEQVRTVEQARALAAQPPAIPIVDRDREEEPVEAADESEEATAEAGDADTQEADTHEEAEAFEGEAPAGAEHGEEGEPGRRRRRRRRRGRRGDAEGGHEGSERAGGARQRSEPREAGEGHGVNGEANDWQSGADDEPGAGEEAHGEEERAAEGPRTNGNGNGDARRRRRRGRRGGRRNRREEGDFRPSGEHASPPADEDASDPVADRGGPSPEDIAPEAHDTTTASDERDAHSTAPSRDPDPVHHEEPPSTVDEPLRAAESPRRRSTVREPVHFAPSAGAAVAESAAPPAAAIETAPAEAAPAEGAQEGKPRRAGWWGKRVLGGK